MDLGGVEGRESNETIFKYLLTPRHDEGAEMQKVEMDL